MNDRSFWDIGVVFVLGILAILIRAVYLSGSFTFRTLAKALLFGGFVGGTMFMLFYDMAAIPPMMRGALVGISTMFAEDIVLGVYTVIKQYKKDPLALIEKFWPWRMK